MDALIARLTNLGYEFFGILLPGALALAMWTVAGIAAGPVLPTVSGGVVPQITIASLGAKIESFAEWSPLVSASLFLGVTYFVGHLLTWVARSGKAGDKVGFWRTFFGALILHPPKRKPSYDLRFEPMWRWAALFLLDEDVEHDWLTFYPVAKVYLLDRGQSTLTTTYQNKYTLHRSLSAASAITFWGSLATLVISAFIAPAPIWFLVYSTLLLSAFTTWGFSASYLYNWTLWGNYLINEVYVALRKDKSLI